MPFIKGWFMIFNSVEFLLIFLPFCIAAFFLLRKIYGRRAQLLFLIFASLVYYVYWNPLDIIFVLLVVAGNYTIMVSDRISSRAKLILGIGLNTVFLLSFKLLIGSGVGFGDGTIESPLGKVALPLGLSFIVLQQITFVVDYVQGRNRDRDPVDYFFFVSFFPQLVSGPIVRHDQIIPQTRRKPFTEGSWRFVAIGLIFFAIGIAKKTLIADPLSDRSSVFLANIENLTAFEAWLNVFVYTFRIYFDFSAYADMAMGIGYFFGIRLPRNFTSPYKSTNIIQFWRCWHITLYHFFRSYLYKYMRLYGVGFALGCATVMFVSAVWHGVGLGYILWGLGHAALMILYYWARKAGLFEFFNHLPGFLSSVSVWLCRGFTFLLVSLLWIPFATNDVGATLAYFDRLMELADFGAMQIGGQPLADLNDVTLVLVSAAVAFLFPNSHQLALGNRFSVWPLIFSGVLIAISLNSVVQRAGTPVPFLYFQF
jgi:alginate O-acetyltransferase complex protein AlgI